MTNISVCIIAKNESHIISQMLASVRDLSDDLIVVDTGSADITRELAVEAGARVESYTWNNDFAAARNFSLSLARRPWILILDCDERLDQEVHAGIRALTERSGTASALQRQHFVSTDNVLGFVELDKSHSATVLGAIGYYTTADFRFFPNDPAVRFTGVVHESCEDSLRQLGYEMEYTNLILEHYGPLLKSDKNKGRWYLDLALEKVAKDENDARNNFQAGVELQSNNRHLEAMKYLQRASALDPSDSSIWRQLGISLCALGEYVEGLSALKTALSLNDRLSFNWLAVGNALLEIGMLDDAERCFNTILASDQNNHLAKKGLAIIRQKQA